MKNVILLITLTLAMTACSGGGSGAKNPTPAAKAERKPLPDTTDLSTCSGPTPEGLNLQSYSWVSTSSSDDGFSLVTTFTFSADKVVQKAVGTFEGRSQDIYVTSKYKVEGSKLTLLDSDYAQGVILNGAGNVKFSVEFNPITVTYSFVGSCLKLELEGEKAEIATPLVKN